MKKIFCVFLIVIMCLSSIAVGEGLLPSLTDAYGVGMPSFGAVLHHYPDEEVTDESGNTIQSWYNIEESDFESFSDYLGNAGVSLQDYSVDNSILTAVIEKQGRTFTFVYDSEGKTATVTYPKGTYDERSYEAESHYNKAMKNIEGEQYKEAYIELTMIEDYDTYKDISSLLKENRKLAAAAREVILEPYKTVGNIVTFGAYEQDNNKENGPEPIEWIVLDVQEDKALLLSKYALDTKPYNAQYADVTWENCTLRKWLNDDFLKTAFSETERMVILSTNTDNSRSQGDYDTYGGSNTKDQIFLLSYHEAFDLFFSNDEARRCAPTAFAIANGAWTTPKYKVGGNSTGIWWLRSPGQFQSDVMSVANSGSRNMSLVTNDKSSVRPAFWLNLESGIF